MNSYPMGKETKEIADVTNICVNLENQSHDIMQLLYAKPKS